MTLEPDVSGGELIAAIISPTIVTSLQLEELKPNENENP